MVWLIVYSSPLTSLVLQTQHYNIHQQNHQLYYPSMVPWFFIIFFLHLLKLLPSNLSLWLFPYIKSPPLGERRVIGTNIHRKDEQDVSERKKRSSRVEGFRGLQFTGGGRRVKAVDSLWLSNPLIPGLWSGIGGAKEGADPSLCPLSVKASP